MTNPTPPAMDGAELRAIRHALGLTQAELGDRLGGIHRVTVRRWETGAWPVPGPISQLVRYWDRAGRRRR